MSSQIDIDNEIDELMKKCLEEMKRTAKPRVIELLKQTYSLITIDPLKSMELFRTAKLMSDLLRQ
jgi:hypothetical protein